MPRVIQGYAIEPNTDSVGKSAIQREWREEHLRPAASSLADCPVTTEAGETVDSTVGRVKYAEYIDGRGVRYEAEIIDEDAVEIIHRGGVGLAPRAQVESPEPNEQEPYIARDIEFTSLFITPCPCDNVPEIGRPGIDRKI